MKLLDHILAALNFIHLLPFWRDVDSGVDQQHLRNIQPLVPSQSPKRIAVVGGGTSGLSFLKVSGEYQKEHNVQWEISLFEQRHDIGGVWCITFPDLDVPPQPH